MCKLIGLLLLLSPLFSGCRLLSSPVTSKSTPIPLTLDRCIVANLAGDSRFDTTAVAMSDLHAARAALGYIDPVNPALVKKAFQYVKK